MVKFLTRTKRNNMLKVENKYLNFKTSIAEVKTLLLIDNKNKTELINEFFICINKISFFELENFFNLTLRNGKIV